MIWYGNVPFNTRNPPTDPSTKKLMWWVGIPHPTNKYNFLIFDLFNQPLIKELTTFIFYGSLWALGSISVFTILLVWPESMMPHIVLPSPSHFKMKACPLDYGPIHHKPTQIIFILKASFRLSLSFKFIALSKMTLCSSRRILLQCQVLFKPSFKLAKDSHHGHFSSNFYL